MEYHDEDMQEYPDSSNEYQPSARAEVTSVYTDETNPQIEDASTTTDVIASTSTSTTTKKRSWVWDYFTWNNSVEKAQCNFCKIYISANKGSTSGMSNHLRHKHPIKIHRDKSQLTLQEALQNTTVEVTIKYLLL